MADILQDRLTATSDPDTKQALMSRPYGGSGARIIEGTSLVSALNIYWIEFRADTVFETLTPVAGFNITNIVGKTFAAGAGLGVRASAVKLTSGEILCYELPT